MSEPTEQADQRPAPAPAFTMIGNADSVVCIDGVCVVPDAGRPADPSDAQD
ncbi:hypothetical protein [Nakamurella leprariae]|uniref:Uncharacterized protein n=1 Tax=Nakamurella leprariae TaxID=2803911 RepID=A0A938YIY6_9ACTN|nr:hypothetical protein [Nakamurella leprariae]MBM9468723.1 hypothetical protein [Nakamurella leprariae]